MSTHFTGALESSSLVYWKTSRDFNDSDSNSGSGSGLDSEDLTHASDLISTPVPLPRLDLKRLQSLRAPTHIAEDGSDKLGKANPKPEHLIGITFIDQFSEEEAQRFFFPRGFADQRGLHRMGIDGGDVFKEFLTDLSKEVFGTGRGL